MFQTTNQIKFNMGYKPYLEYEIEWGLTPTRNEASLSIRNEEQKAIKNWV